MSCGSIYYRLHRLINDSVRPFIELEEVVSLTQEKEKKLLASLSQASRQIQLWTRQHDSDSDCEWRGESEDHNYLSNILADLVYLLTLKTRYVRHLAGNILVVISGFLATFGSNWGFYLHILCLCMELVITNALSSSSATSIDGLGNSHFNSSSFLVVKPRLRNAGWSTLAEIVRVLREISKWLNKELKDDENLAEVYFDSVHSCLSNVPWDSMDMIYCSQNSFSVDALGPRALDAEESGVVFMGNLMQLLCSMVEQCGSTDDGDRSLDEHPILCLVTNLVPKLFSRCLEMQGEHVVTCMSRYFRHKLLVLMIRLSSQVSLDCCILVSWLQLLRQYCQELLWQPITSRESFQDDCLEGSPFHLSKNDRDICSHHLKRQVVFLFLRCCFSLINLREGSKKHVACGLADSCLMVDTDLDHIRKEKGWLELYDWLRGHLQLDIYVDYESYTKNCINFSLSFLQLFVHEDDALFKVLLQLLSVPFTREQRSNKRKWTSRDVMEDTVFHVSNVFNPVRLFHLFLAEIHYDHQVLLDYLISVDTGTDCAEYLLRCLRLVNDSWPLFMEFSCGEEFSSQSSDKRRKMVWGNSNGQYGLSSTTLKDIPLPEEEFKSDLGYGYDLSVVTESPCTKAKECLFSLKTSIENLHLKNLFLYNPEVLLKRNELKHLSERSRFIIIIQAFTDKAYESAYEFAKVAKLFSDGDASNVSFCSLIIIAIRKMDTSKSSDGKANTSKRSRIGRSILLVTLCFIANNFGLHQ